MLTWSPTTEQTQAVLAPAGLTLRSIHRPKNGLTGTVFVLLTDQGRFILKVCLDPACDWKPEKERLVNGLLRRQGLPAPIVRAADLSRRLVPFTYTLSECLPGVPFSQAYTDMAAVERLDLYVQLGDLLGRMHSLTFDRFGDVCEDHNTLRVGPAQELIGQVAGADCGPFTTWREMHRQIVRGRLSYLSRTEFRDLTQLLNAWFDSHEALLDYPILPRLLHMDLHMSNILVLDGRISGILDVEESLIGHNEYDLMRTELAHFGPGYEMLREAFFQGYSAHIVLDAAYDSRKIFYELSRSLVGLSCLVLYGSRTGLGLAEETHQARARIHELMEMP